MQGVKLITCAMTRSVHHDMLSVCYLFCMAYACGAGSLAGWYLAGGYCLGCCKVSIGWPEACLELRNKGAQEQSAVSGLTRPTGVAACPTATSSL